MQSTSSADKESSANGTTNGDHLHVSVLERALEFILLTSLNLILGRLADGMGQALLGIESLVCVHVEDYKECRGKRGMKVSNE